MTGYKFKEFKKILKRNGFSLDRISGDHHIYRNETGVHITLPYKQGHRELPRPMILRLIKENKLTV